MKAVVIESINKAVVKELPYPEPVQGEVTIKVEAAGICGSDVHIFHGTYPARYPLVPGHEFAGIIDAIAPDVTGWKLGQRVTADPNIYCGKCYYCTHDQENMCEATQVPGVTQNGGFAQYVTIPAKQLFLLPDSMTFEQGALVEPLSCVVYALLRLKPRFGDRAIIFGAGPMGLLLLMGLRHGGASEVSLVDIQEERLNTAKALGATSVYHNVKEAKAATPRGFDLVIDATGNLGVIESMFTVAAKRAKILQFGCASNAPDATISISPFQVYDNDWEYIGTRALLLTFIQAIDFIKNGIITGEHIITHKIPLEKVPQYFDGNKPPNSLKTVIKPWMEEK